MDRYKKFMLITGVLLIAITVIFLKLFVLKTKDVRRDSFIEQNKSKSINESPVREKVMGTVKPDHIDVKKFDVKLSESDKFLKSLLLSSINDKKIKKFLVFNDLILRFVSAVDNISRGESPAKNLDFLEPFEKFIPGNKEGKFLIGEISYSRYDYLVNIFDSFNNVFLAETYLSSEKLIDKAYKSLGYKDIKFDDTLYEAMRVLLETPMIKGDIFLREGVTTYKYENPDFESLNRAQKHFLRLGPKNMKKIKKKLIEISLLLGFKFKL